LVGVAACAAVLLASACEKSEGREKQASAGAPGAQADSGAKDARGAAGGRRGPLTLTLAASDVKPVERGVIEGGPAVSGNLRPIEEVPVRARLEGNLVGLYVREGDHVNKGQVIARFEASEQVGNQRSAEADVESAKSDLSTAQWNADQSAELFKAGAIPERDLRTAQQAVAASQARLAAAEARLRSMSIAENDTRVLAPTSGTVSQRLVDNGQHVARGEQLYTIVRNDVLELAAAVPARQANEVRAGQPVRFSAAGRAIEGRVARVSPTIDPTTQAVTVYAQVPNPGGQIKGNAFATGKIVAQRLDAALIVPTSAVRQGADGGAYVYRVNGGTLERAPIGVGIIDEAKGIAEITNGLALGDRVIVGSVGTVGNGMKVNIVGGDQGGTPEAPAGGTRARKRPQAAGQPSNEMAERRAPGSAAAPK
jgi:RND family efflux transporter MFP subunit